MNIHGSNKQWLPDEDSIYAHVGLSTTLCCSDKLLHDHSDFLSNIATFFICPRL